MFISIGKYLSNLSPRHKLILLSALGFAIAYTPIGITFILINSRAVSYKNQDTEISFEGKAQQISNDTQYSHRALTIKLANLQQQIQELQHAKKDPEKLQEQANEVTQTFNDLIPTVNEAVEDIEQLNELVESAIADGDQS